jgi:hypothetical protein
VNHSTAIQPLGEGAVQAVCSCGWRSPVFGTDKTTGTMDPLQHATEAADLHEWEMSLRLAFPPDPGRLPDCPERSRLSPQAQVSLVQRAG